MLFLKITFQIEILLFSDTNDFISFQTVFTNIASGGKYPVNMEQEYLKFH